MGVRVGCGEVIRLMTQNFLCLERQRGIDPPPNQNPADAAVLAVK